MGKKRWYDDEGFYCERCDKEISEHEAEMYDGLCAKCRKIKTEARKQRRRKEYFEERDY